MRTFVYDRSFEGLLTAVFHAYARREFPDFLAVEGEPGPLFVEERFRVVTDEVLAARVWRGLEQRAGKGVCNMVLCVWLSEEEGPICSCSGICVGYSGVRTVWSTTLRTVRYFG